MSEDLNNSENLVGIERIANIGDFKNLNPETKKKTKGWWNHDKEYNLGVENNQIYWDEFKKLKWRENPDKQQILSMRQYKSSIMNFMQFVQKDILPVSRKEVEAFLETVENETTRANKQAHIKSILTFIVQKNIMGAMGRASKNALLTIIML
jgi:hypothetical protein